MIDLTQVVVAIIGLLSAVLSAYLVPYVKAKTTKEQRENALMWTKIGVQAAEMIFKQTGMGPEKFEYVKTFLESRGFTFSEYEIKALIESAVLELKAEVMDDVADS